MEQGNALPLPITLTPHQRSSFHTRSLIIVRSRRLHTHSEESMLLSYPALPQYKADHNVQPVPKGLYDSTSLEPYQINYLRRSEAP